MTLPVFDYAARRLGRRLLLTLSILLPATTPLGAQEYRSERIDGVGIEITVSNRLKRLPVRLDTWDPHLRARFRPQDEKDYVQTREGPSYWYTDVYEFKKAPAAGPITPGKQKTGEGEGGKSGEGEGGEGGEEGGTPEDIEARANAELARLLAELQSRSRIESFEEWLKEKKPLRVVTEGKAVKRRGFLPYKFWEFHTEDGTTFEWYNGAAVYEFEGREVALVVSMPLDKGDRPQGKFGTFCRRCLGSGKALPEAEAEDDSAAGRDKYADTPEKQEALAAAKANIASLRDWDYFTTDNYIVLYSWEKTGERMKSRNFSMRLAQALESMRGLYQEYYSPREGMKMPYSVFRVCATYEQFQRYGESPPGVVGWFSPSSKELVVFQGGDKLMRQKGATDVVTFHEGWHQYSDSYFGGVELHRWFDEGHGDFFGAHDLRGSKWNYVGSDMRHKWVKLMVKKGDYVPFKTIVFWPRSKFYGSPKSAYYYAQAYGIIDFLRRGTEMGKRFDPKWSDVLETYRRVTLEKESAEEGAKAAFENVDFEAMETAWKEWVDGPHFRKP